MRYLLDTNMVSDLVRHPQGQVTQAIRAIGEAQVCTSIIVAAELRYGATKRGSPRLSRSVSGPNNPSKTKTGAATLLTLPRQSQYGHSLHHCRFARDLLDVAM